MRRTTLFIRAQTAIPRRARVSWCICFKGSRQECSAVSLKKKGEGIIAKIAFISDHYSLRLIDRRIGTQCIVP